MFERMDGVRSGGQTSKKIFCDLSERGYEWSQGTGDIAEDRCAWKRIVRGLLTKTDCTPNDIMVYKRMMIKYINKMLYSRRYKQKRIPLFALPHPFLVLPSQTTYLGHFHLQSLNLCPKCPKCHLVASRLSVQSIYFHNGNIHCKLYRSMYYEFLCISF